MPRRTDEHKLESDSENAFKAVVESAGHVYRRLPEPDYGIDGEVEEFDDAGEPTGNRFFVQLKATAQEGAAAMRVRMPLDKLDYYRAQPVPVLMVRYVAVTDKLFGRWFHEFDGYLENVGETHFTFHWYPENELEAGVFGTLMEHARRLRRLRSQGVDLPLQVAFEIPGEGAHGFTRTELAVALSTAAKRVRGTLTESSDPEGADLVAAIDEVEIRASLSGLASVTFHLGEGVYVPETSAESIAADVMTCLAGALARAQQGAAAAPIARGFLADSLLSALPEIAGEIALEMRRAGRTREILELSDLLDADGETSRETTAGILNHLVMTTRDTLEPAELDLLESNLRARFERRVERGQPGPAAASAENVGRVLMDRQERAEAAEFFNRALELDPTRETPDFAQIRAGALFLSDQYEAAVTAYDRALELASEDEMPGLSARRADALMYAGRYREALEGFAAIEPEHRNREAWVFVKMRALIAVLEETEIEAQTRDPVRAHELAGVESRAEFIDKLEEIWKLDAANHRAWWRYGKSLYDAGGVREAAHAFLVAAVICEGDVDAWINATILAAQIEDWELLTAAAVTGARLNADTFMPGIVKVAREMIEDLAEREQFLSGVRDAIERGERTEARK
jgi:tetratricopeptide (TPR) repeat protein